MIGILDYGLGNVQAFDNIYRRLGIEACIVRGPQELSKATRIILPGVGAFDWAVRRLRQSRMLEALTRLVLEENRPVLGVCVGMQILADSSEEGELPGLGWIPGVVRRFHECGSAGPVFLPQMGWNQVEARNGSRLFRGLEKEAEFYFLHSYYFIPQNPEHAIGVTDYHGAYASSVSSGAIYGVQFHPEKSHHWGIQLLKNFAEL